MPPLGTVIAFSGALAAGTSRLSQLVAQRLNWPWVRFSDFIREYARTAGEDPADPMVLQRIGQDLVQSDLEFFVEGTLRMAEWSSGYLIIDGLRHVEVYVELKKQLAGRAHLRVVHVSMDFEHRRNRAVAGGIEQLMFDFLDKDITEAQIERVLPPYAELTVKGTDSPDDLVEQIVHGFAPSESGGTAAVDRHEDVTQMEPLAVGEASPHRARLRQLAESLITQSRQFSDEIPAGVKGPLAELVRSMNCYYSNLLEGHKTHPVDIERALRNKLSENPETRNLQLEALAHIATQKWLDDGGLGTTSPFSEVALCEIHHRFCSQLPDDLLWAVDPQGGAKWRVVPGQYRMQDVVVGRHIPPSSGALPRFMKRFEQFYSAVDGLEQVIASAIAHHRLLWIHPFLDGNGRVARLMSHKVLCDSLATDGVWSVARGLARKHDSYKWHLASCDQPRRNSLDGRGALSEENLAAFAEFFLGACLDQVEFMRGVIQPERIRVRLQRWCNEEADLGHLPSDAFLVLDRALTTSDLSQQDAEDLLGKTPKPAQVISLLEAEGILIRDTTSDRLRLSFPAKLCDRLLPGLFPGAL